MSELNLPSPARLLVVDDDRVVCDVLVRWLAGAGYCCAQARSAAEALAHLEAHPVDLATLDIRMPGCSGIELLAQMQARFPDTAALMLTGEGDTSKAVFALTHGACGYLTKPIDEDELLAQVHNGLERRRLALENRQHLRNLEELVRQQVQTIRAAHEETIHRLVRAALYRDEETGAHIRRTGWYSEVLAAAAGWERRRIDEIRLAAPLHDVGKIAIPDGILRKPGKLTPEEFRLMQSHTILGAQMLARSTSPVLQMAEEIALAHHERWDGTGYPAGLAGEAIPESGRIVAIVDVYDALTHDRVYRPALSEAEALELMRDGRGKHFDPRLLDTFLTLLPEMRSIAEALPDHGDDAWSGPDAPWRAALDEAAGPVAVGGQNGPAAPENIRT